MGAKSSGNRRHIEVERKFEVVDSTVTPSFEGLSLVGHVERLPAQLLEAVYFDTVGHRLAAYGITLRRRTGGTDAGWHLKLPAGPDTRTEVRASLGEHGVPDGDPENVPEALRDVVLAIVRNEPLHEVARITTQRTVAVLHGTDHAKLAEFCDDLVTASANVDAAAPVVEQRWREWEIELAEGVKAPVLERLANRLLDAGAQPARHGSKLARALDTAGAAAEPETRPAPPDPVHRAVAEQVDQLLVWDRAVRADAYDSVHQMRVTTRKIRSLLQASGDTFGISDDAWVLDELRQFASVLGVARDAEVLAERYAHALGELPSHLVRGPVEERLVGGARKRYASGLRRSLIAMRSQRYFRLLDALEALAAARPTTDPDRKLTPVTLDPAYERVRRAAKKARKAVDEDRDEALHRIRKGAKRLRYTAAATGADKVSRRAKTIQSLLGDHQDSVVSRRHLSQQAEAAHAAGEDTFTYGLLYQREEDLATRCREQLDGALQKLDKSVRKAR